MSINADLIVNSWQLNRRLRTFTPRPNHLFWPQCADTPTDFDVLLVTNATSFQHPRRPHTSARLDTDNVFELLALGHNREFFSAVALLLTRA
jgi:hypothetical protein